MSALAWGAPPGRPTRTWSAPPLAPALVADLNTAVGGRPGWRPPQPFAEQAATAEWRHALGEPGGVLVGSPRGWSWFADDGRGREIATGGPLKSAALARDALERTVRAHLRVP